MGFPALDTAHARKRDPDPPWQYFRMNVMHLQQDQRYTAPGCPHTFADAPATEFRWCARCRRVRYCSRRCQRAAWAHPHAAHRQICAVLLRACVDSGMQRTRFSSELEAPPEFNMRLAVAVSGHCAAQTRFKIETSCMYRDEAEWTAEVKQGQVELPEQAQSDAAIVTHPPDSSHVSIQIIRD